MPQFLQNLQRYANDPLEFVNGVVRVGRKIGNEIEYGRKQINNFIEDVVPEPIVNTLDSASLTLADTAQFVYENHPVGLAEQGAIILGGNTAETVGLPRGVGEFVGGALAPGFAAPAPSAITRATRAATKNSVKTAVKETAEGLKTIGDDLMPPPPAALATAGAAPRVQLNVSGGKANLNLAPQVMEAVTLKNPKILKPLGLETGDEIVDAAQAKFNTKRLQKIEQSASKELTAKKAIQNLKDTYGRKPSKAENELVYRMFSRAEGALGRAKEDLSRAQSNVFADKDVYFRSTPSKKAKAVEIINRRTYRKIPNNVSIQIDEHHGFPKGMSAALFDRMDQFIAKGIADPDDLLVMARHAERKGALAGDYKSNMINLVKKPHDELHNYLKNSGDELSKKQWIDVARKAETPDDLLIIFDDLLDRNVIPNLETAKIWQPLSDLIEDIQKAP